MKKVLLLLIGLSTFALAQDAEAGVQTIKAFSALGAGLAITFAAGGGAIGLGNTAAAAISGIARNPGLSGKLTGMMFIAMAIIEAAIIYALVIVFILLYGNPFL
ncbi:MAG: F0F1 ATP synthase subunit C [Campylobacteraceae bacterium]